LVISKMCKLNRKRIEAAHQKGEVCEGVILTID